MALSAKEAPEMLEWLQRTYADTAKRLKAVEVEQARLQGGLAALEAAITQARKEAGGGNGAAPIQQTSVLPTANPLAGVQGVQEMVKVPHGPIQAEQELRE